MQRSPNDSVESVTGRRIKCWMKVSVPEGEIFRHRFQAPEGGRPLCTCFLKRAALLGAGWWAAEMPDK